MTKKSTLKNTNPKEKPTPVSETVKISNKTKYILLSLVLFLTILVYSNSFKNQFVNYDDEHYIQENKYIKSLSAQNISEIFTSFYFSNYHPLTTLSYAIDYHFAYDKITGNINPVRFHIINLLIHLLNILLVFELLFLLIKNVNLSAVGALVFAIHPMHVESVSWISERKDVLFAFFFLLSLITYINYQRREKKYKFLVYSFICFVLSLLSKSMAVTLPVLLILFDYYKEKKIILKNILDKIPFLLLSIIFGVFAIKSQHQGGAVSDLSNTFSFINQVFLVCYSIIFYIFKFFAPYNLSVLHSYPQLIDGTLPLSYYLSFLVVLGIIGTLIFISFKFKKEIIFGLLFFLISISIVLQIIPVGQAMVAERYTYIPYLGFIFLILQFYLYLKENKIKFFNRAKPYIIALMVVYLAGFSYLSWSRNKVWENSTKLWTDVIDKDSKNFYGHYSLANAFYSKGQLDEAINHYNSSIQINPSYAESYYSRGTTKFKQNDFKGAIEDFTFAIQFKPNYQDAYSNRGTARLQLQDFLNAKIDFDHAIEINPNDPVEYYNRGNVEYYMQNDSLALKDLNKAINLKPVYPEAYLNRGLVYYYMKKLNEACNDWNLALNYGNQDAANYLNQFCK